MTQIHKNAFYRVSRTPRALRVELVNPKEVLDAIETCSVPTILEFCKKYPTVSVALPGLNLPDTSKKKPNPTLLELAEVAEVEAVKSESLVDGDCYVWENYVKPLIPAMQELGHIGDGYVHINWCACFVWAAHDMADIPIPTIPQAQGTKFWASSALCEALEWFAKKRGCYIKNRLTSPCERGWTVFYDWDNNEQEDHCGIVLADKGSYILAAEGNYKNQTAIVTRSKIRISGYADFSCLKKEEV